MMLDFNKILLAFIFVYPITPWYITFGPLNLVNIVSIIFIVLWVICSKKEIARLSGTSFFFWCYLITYSVQALIDTTLMRAVAYIIAQLIVCLIVYTEIRRRDILTDALHMLVYAAGFLTVTGLIEEVSRTNIFHIISGQPSASFYTETRLGIYRIETAFSHPIVYCAYLCFIAGLLIYLMDSEMNITAKRILKAIYILVLVNAILTMSRSALLVLLIEQLILGYMQGIVNLSKKVILITAFIGIILMVSSMLDLPYMARLKDIWYMFLAIFNDDYVSMYSTSFGMNESAVGNRLDLYYWVADSVKGHEWFGMGTSTDFEYTVNAIESTWSYSYTWTKTSIENEYLYNFYIHGFIGLITFVLNICSVIIYAIRTMKKRKMLVSEEDRLIENRIEFPKLMTVLLIGYAITLFSVRSSDNVRVFNILMCILFAYSYKIRRWLRDEKSN